MVIQATLIVHGANPTPLVMDSRAIEGVVIQDGAHHGVLVMRDGTRLPIDDADFVLDQMMLGIPMGQES